MAMTPRQMRAELATKRRLKRMWVTFDVNDSDFGEGQGYAWFFKTKKAALEHKKRYEAAMQTAELIGPFKYQGE